MDMYRILESFDAVNNKIGVSEGKVKRSMHADADEMSRAEFVDKYGVESGEFWDNIRGELDEDKKKDVAEGEQTMSRAAKGNEKYGKEGMQALAKAGREGKDLDPVRAKYNKYEEAVTEDVSELKNVKHFAKPGGYGRKIDKDDESGDAFHSSDIDDIDDTDDASAAKASVKRGRGRPMKGGDSETGITKKYDTDTLSSWIIGNKPKNIDKIGKVSHVHRLKEYMEMIERKTIVEGYVAEGRMSELAMIVDDIIDGHLDINDIISGKYIPTSDLEDFVQQTLIKSYKDIARDRGLSADDDKIIGIMYNEIHDIMSNALNKDIDEQAMPEATQSDMTTSTTLQQPVPVNVNGQIVGMAPNQAAAQQATQKMTQNSNNQKELAKLGVTQVQESLSDTMNRFSSILNVSQSSRTVDRRTLSESKTPKLVLEGTLEEIIAVHPHEHKMCQEGWGMDESLYEALCDYYHKEGRIPRKVWHGSSEDLRKCVEECYLKDTQSLMSEDDNHEVCPECDGAGCPECNADEFYDNYDHDLDMKEGFAGGALGGIAGALLTKSPSGALVGAKFGSDIQDSFENEEMNLRRHAMTGLIDELDESHDDGLEAAHKKAKQISADHGVVQHIERDPETGHHSVSDWYDSDTTVATYNNGKLREDMSESKKPSAGMTKDEKSSLVKKAKSGKDIGKSGKGFDKLAKKAAEKYGSAEKGKKVAAAAMWKNAASTNEDEEQLDELSKDTLGSYAKKSSADASKRQSDVTGANQFHKGVKFAADKIYGDKIQSYPDRTDSKIAKRQSGIEKAVDRMTKESISPDDFDQAAISKGKRGRDARDNPSKAVASAKRSPAAQDARAKLDKVRQSEIKVKESAKPDFLDLDKDGNKKESMKKASSDKKKVKENVNVAQMHANTFRPGDKAIARDGSQVTIVKVEGNGDVLIKSLQDSTSQRVDSRTLKSVGSSGKALAESYDFSEWNNQLSLLLKPTTKQAVSESAKIKKQMINESSNELSTMLQFAGLKNVQQVMEEFNASIYSDDSESTSLTDGADNPPQLAMPTGMGMSQQKEDDDESTVVEPMMSDEVIGGLEKCDKESAKSDNDHLSFFKKMLSHGLSEVKTEKPKSESDEQSGIPSSTSQSSVSEETSDKSVTEDDVEEGNAFTGALAKARSDGVQSGETMKVGGKTYPVKENTDVTASDNGDNEEEQSEVSSDATRDAGIATAGSNFFSSENSSTMAEDEHQDMSSDSIIGDILAKLTQLVGSEQGQSSMSAEPPVMVDIEYADDEQSQDYADEESQDEEHCDQCQSCGDAMYQNHQCMESLNEWANSPTGESADEQFQTDMDFMTKVISGGLNNQKQDQTTLPSTRVVTRDESKDVSNTMGAMLRKLSGIN